MDILISTLAFAAFFAIVAAVIVLNPASRDRYHIPESNPDDVETYRDVDRRYRSTGPPGAGARLMWVMLVMLAFVALMAMVVIQTTVM